MLNLKIARIKKGYTQKFIAEQLNVSLNTVSRWEKGERTMTVDKLIQLAEILDTTTDYLLGRDNDN